MKKFSAYLLICILPAAKVFSQTKGYVDRNTKEYILKAKLGDEFTIYGFELPDYRSKKIIAFSVPNIAKSDPYTLGAYGETTGIKDGDKITYVGKKGDYAEMNYISKDKKITTFYVRRKYVEAE